MGRKQVASITVIGPLYNRSYCDLAARGCKTTYELPTTIHEPAESETLLYNYLQINYIILIIYLNLH